MDDETLPADEAAEGGMIRSSIAMPQDMFDDLDAIAARRRSNRSSVIREACARLIEAETLRLERVS